MQNKLLKNYCSDLYIYLADVNVRIVNCYCKKKKDNERNEKIRKKNN